MNGSHYKPKNISELNVKTDSRVAIIGKVVDIGENSFVLEDTTGKVEIVFEGAVERDRLVRAFCSIIDERLRADVVQDLKNFDVDMFFKVKELYNKAGV
jgi:hypothetical protein